MGIVVNSNGGESADLKSLIQAIGALLLPTRMQQSAGAPPPPLSEKEQSMLESPVFMYYLVKQIKGPTAKEFVTPLIERAVYDSTAVTKAAIGIIGNCLKKDDGADCKAAMRAALVLVKMPEADPVFEFRLTHLMTTLASELQANSRYISATEVCLDMLLRICKASPRACHWVRLNWASKFKWIESWLSARRSGTIPQGSVMLKPRPAGSVNTAVAVKTVVKFHGFSTPEAKLAAFRCILTGNGGLLTTDVLYYDR